jgi:hypothetical protein
VPAAWLPAAWLSCPLLISSSPAAVISNTVNKTGLHPGGIM